MEDTRGIMKKSDITYDSKFLGAIADSEKILKGQEQN